ncbi:membrane protein YdbS with pleckstrin-like domain [Leifsonia sp. AK011]|uniref:hypothetical protein n=1 Tax=Leifsonia sp. AK011 TaxID=2723075 RepID=UPI0015CC3AAD|nr:hypothetical protein [Leifsonia sp. AK011]NYF09810.1 membrane protein YdbS with pleckstrin-like domain [Leifsonia sp. AK011]
MTDPSAGSSLFLIGGVVLLVGGVSLLVVSLLQKRRPKWWGLSVAVALAAVALSLVVLIPRLFD